MTDVVAVAPDDELLSRTEVVPKPAEGTPLADGAGRMVHECPECGARANKVGLPFFTLAQVNTHRANQHGYSAPKPEKKAPAKKATAQKKAAPSKPPSTPSNRAPSSKPSAARKPLGESIARIVLQLGRIINTVEPPTGAAIMFEAGALGQAIDNAIAGTFLDKPLQKASATTSKIEPLVPLVSLPALIFMASRDQKLADMLEGEIREALEDVLAQSLPLLKKRAARTKETLDALAELKVIDPDLYGSEDPVGSIIQGFFDNTGDVAGDAEG